MSRISVDQVKHVANLARLAVTDDEAELFTKQLECYYYICRTIR